MGLHWHYDDIFAVLTSDAQARSWYHLGDRDWCVWGSPDGALLLLREVSNAQISGLPLWDKAPDDGQQCDGATADTSSFNFLFRRLSSMAIGFADGWLVCHLGKVHEAS